MVLDKLKTVATCWRINIWKQQSWINLYDAIVLIEPEEVGHMSDNT